MGRLVPSTLISFVSVRQALEDVNARISAVRVRETDSEAATNRLLDEFETAVASFMK